MSRRLVVLGLGLAVSAPLTLLGGPASAAPAPAVAPAVPYDLDGDGRPELVVAAPFLQVGTARAAGGVVVYRGTRRGLSTSGTVITQSSPGVPGSAEEGDELGQALASADLDADGFADLVVGAPYEAVGPVRGAGTVTVLYGSPTGLTGARSVQLTRPGGSDEGFSFGDVLAAADLDGDGYGDLAVPSGGGERSGPDAVSVYRGGPAGLGRTPSASFTVADASALAAGDLDGDGVADLVVGSRGHQQRDDDDLGTIPSTPGTVTVCRGTRTLTSSCATVAAGRRYTALASLAVGNLMGDDAPEIAVGVPEDDDTEGDDPGSVHVLRLRDGIARPARDTTLTQSSRGVPGTDRTSSERDDAFGTTVALGDLDADGYADLVVGAVGENTSRGRVTVVHGARGGWRTRGNRALDQDTKGIPSKAHRAELFGQALVLADHDGDGRLDLSVGADDTNAVGGVVSTLRGGGKDVTTRGARTYGLPELGYPTPYEAGFGEVLGG